jgi:hypothetical protein
MERPFSRNLSAAVLALALTGGASGVAAASAAPAARAKTAAVLEAGWNYVGVWNTRGECEEQGKKIVNRGGASSYKCEQDGNGHKLYTRH